VTSPPTSTPWVPVAQAGIPTPVNGKWLTAAGGSMVWSDLPYPAADTAWKIIGTDIALQNGWVNYGTPYGPGRYRKLVSGLVIMDGLIQSGTIGAAAFTMPVGYRPMPQADGSSRILIFQLAIGGGTYTEGARIGSADGNFVPTAPAAVAWISLSGVAYLAA
jgi:hypothetical protein